MKLNLVLWFYVPAILKTNALTSLFPSYCGKGYHEQQSLPWHPIQGSEGTKTSTQSFWRQWNWRSSWRMMPPEGQMFFGHHPGLSPLPASSSPYVLWGISRAIMRPKVWIFPIWTLKHWKNSTWIKNEIRSWKRSMMHFWLQKLWSSRSHEYRAQAWIRQASSPPCNEFPSPQWEHGG